MVDKTATEQTILTVAERLFLERGFALTSTTDIAREAGCNQALINYYFRTKEKLFASIFEKKFTLFFASMGETLMSELPFREKIQTLVVRHFEMIVANPNLPSFLVNEFSQNPHRIEVVKATIVSILGTLMPRLEADLRAEVEAGRIRSVSLGELLVTLGSLNIGVFLLRPVLQGVLGLSDADMAELISRRGAENARILMASLAPEATR